MPEANVLYPVTAAVVLGLVVWVGVVLKGAKEPWARATPAPPPKPDVPIEPDAAAPVSATTDVAPPSDAKPPTTTATKED